MIKKILSVITCLVLVSSLCAFAAESDKPEVKLSNANKDIVSVFGKAPAGTGVVVTILNVGYSKSDLDYNGYSALTDAIAFTGAAVSGNDGTYNFQIKLRDNGKNPEFGGIFKVLLTVGGTEYELPFEFYYYAKKLEVIRKFNNPGDGALSGILADAVKYYSFAQSNLWTEGNSEKTLEALLNIQNECDGDKFPEDPELFFSYLEDALLISALNTGNSSVLVDNGGYLREELLRRLAENPVQDYKGFINKTGVTSLNTDLIKGKYNLFSDVSQYFDNELIPFYAIAQYKDSGFGHVTGYIEKYSDAYEKAGFRVSDFKELTNTDKNKFLVKFNDNTFSGLSDMATKFNDSFNTQENNPTVGGSVQGGGAPSGGGGGGKVVSDTKPNEGAYVKEPSESTEPVKVYSDVADVPWATKAIGELSKNGIISGYGGGEFRPHNMVSRAEFVKMIVSLLGLSGNPNEALFSDVLSTDWYAPYINVASKEGIVMGGENAAFNPDGSISREDAAVIIFRTLKTRKTFDAEISFGDSYAFSAYADEAIRKLAGAGIISGMGDGTFMPKETLTRAQAAVLIYGAAGIIAE